eukprot:CAMPEP_0167754946 /NCGR_PEP_ID=MMETSP0110_2-20121227/8553_1 /TAXON_ID=629695 /ORGANISM="Gymnochlora sp., Strain CCMP2014" /LENGTH=319 /DNA_ID=CAMNT_0007640883 /DNA_START=54 /DNA_END=1013 /DNA_ORIENTATION=+
MSYLEAGEEEAGPVSYYTLLQVEQDISPKDLKKKYRKLALQHHPDKVKDPEKKREAEDIFMRLSNAYEVLSDTVTRTRYDFLLTQDIYEYDDKRDWSTFDFRNGLGGKNAEYKSKRKFYNSFEDAQRGFDELENESGASLWVALLGALSVGFIPIGMHWRTSALRKQRKGQGIKAAARQQAEENRLKEELIAAEIAKLEEEDDDDEDEAEEGEGKHEEGEETEENDVEIKEDEKATETENALENPRGAENEKEDEQEVLENRENEESPELVGKPVKSSKNSGMRFECKMCRKTYKSENALENHFGSKAHIKKMKKSKKK